MPPTTPHSLLVGFFLLAPALLAGQEPDSLPTIPLSPPPGCRAVPERLVAENADGDPSPVGGPELLRCTHPEIGLWFRLTMPKASGQDASNQASLSVVVETPGGGTSDAALWVLWLRASPPAAEAWKDGEAAVPAQGPWVIDIPDNDAEGWTLVGIIAPTALLVHAEVRAGEYDVWSWRRDSETDVADVAPERTRTDANPPAVQPVTLRLYTGAATSMPDGYRLRPSGQAGGSLRVQAGQTTVHAHLMPAPVLMDMEPFPVDANPRFPFLAPESRPGLRDWQRLSATRAGMDTRSVDARGGVVTLEQGGALAGDMIATWDPRGRLSAAGLRLGDPDQGSLGAEVVALQRAQPPSALEQREPWRMSLGVGGNDSVELGPWTLQAGGRWDAAFGAQRPEARSERAHGSVSASWNDAFRLDLGHERVGRGFGDAGASGTVYSAVQRSHMGIRFGREGERGQELGIQLLSPYDAVRVGSRPLHAGAYHEGSASLSWLEPIGDGGQVDVTVAGAVAKYGPMQWGPRPSLSVDVRPGAALGPRDRGTEVALHLDVAQGLQHLTRSPGWQAGIGGSVLWQGQRHQTSLGATAGYALDCGRPLASALVLDAQGNLIPVTDDERAGARVRIGRCRPWGMAGGVDLSSVLVLGPRLRLAFRGRWRRQAFEVDGGSANRASRWNTLDWPSVSDLRSQTTLDFRLAPQSTVSLGADCRATDIDVGERGLCRALALVTFLPF